MIRFQVLIALVAQSGVALGAQPIEAGEYASEGNAGQLVVAPASAQGMPFQLVSEGANGHTCGMTGRIADGRARVEVPIDEPRVCVVNFVVGAGGEAGAVDVKIDDAPSNFENCRYFCGARAGFDAVYFKVPPGCTTAQRKRTKLEFGGAYAAKQYLRARAVLGALQARCTRFEDQYEQDRLHNDMAVTLHHLGQNALCLRELAATLGAKEGGEAALDEVFVGQPMSFQSYLPIARATWRNQKLCGAPGSLPP